VKIESVHAITTSTVGDVKEVNQEALGMAVARVVQAVSILASYLQYNES
jgi:hypothetical protein